MAESNGELSDDDIIINDQDGLPNVHPNLIPEGELSSPDPEHHTDDEFEDLPASLIVTNIHDSVFASQEKKRILEDLFRAYDPEATFQWLRSFRRVRANFRTPLAAASARIELHQRRVDGSVIACYFAQPVTPVRNPNLRPPAPYKQFLISPPASPPVDWEPRPEGEPIINHDLLAALATLSPGGIHELHPPSPGQPSIVVHTALGGANGGGGGGGSAETPKQQQRTRTPCPERS